MNRADLSIGGSLVRDGVAVPIGELLDLLDAIAATRSVRGAAEALGLSYRAVWGRAATYEAALGQKLVIKTKGHGSGLTPLGARLQDVLRTALREAEPARAACEARLRQDLAGLLDGERPACRLALSHDPLLLDAASSCPGKYELTVAGSREALDRLRAGLADAAGFHDGTEEGGATVPSLVDAGFSVVALFRREQGLMLAPGNPLGIGALAEVAGGEARFVNRQKGSGTRTWFDRLLAEAGLSPGDIRGYGAEEFTHGAVAALVASGQADAGMGVRAAAERLGLTFLPIGHETYFLAVVARSAPIDDLVATVRSRAAAAPGYAPPP